MAKSTEVLELVKKQLARFDEIWKDAEKTKIYTNSAELSNIARHLNSGKLNDEFLVDDLSTEEKEILNKALIIANL